MCLSQKNCFLKHFLCEKNTYVHWEALQYFSFSPSIPLHPPPIFALFHPSFSHKFPKWSRTEKETSPVPSPPNPSKISPSKYPPSSSQLGFGFPGRGGGGGGRRRGGRKWRMMTWHKKGNFYEGAFFIGAPPTQILEIGFCCFHDGERLQCVSLVKLGDL